MDARPLVQIRDLTKTYERGKERIEVLHHINLDIPHGDFVALMGPSGSGKTTLLNLIGGLDSPTSGSIEVAGQRIDQLNGGQLSHWRSQNVGYVFQFYNLMPALTAQKNVELPLLLTDMDTGERRRRAANELGDALFDRLLKPMMTGLQGKHLVIVPQGSLHYLPFAALRQDGKFLIENRALRYLPSAALAGLLRSSDISSIQRLLVLGNPDLNSPELDLPSAQQEAQNLHQKFPNRSELFVRRAASESLVKQRAAEFSHIHLASHGEFSSDNPLGSRLKLAADDRNDGMLTVSEIYGLPLRAHMVVLSACETGLGQITSGDDVIGLTRGFLYAGAKNVVGSLWEVDDDATSTLFQAMYELMAQGRSPKQALAQAQARLLKDKPHPFYWSAFAVVGDGAAKLAR